MSATTLSINSDGVEPLYRRVKNLVFERISSGEWPVHHRLPSENQLVDELGVSRMTVHRALKELTEERVLRRVPGVGTFVDSGKGHLSLIRIEDIRNEIASRGNSHSCEVLLLRNESVGHDVASLFGFHGGASLFHSRILHRENERPAMLEDKYVLPKLVPDYLDQDFEATSTTNYLMSVVMATEAEQYVEAVEPSGDLQKLLTQHTSSYLLYSRRVWVHDTVALYCERVYPGSPYRLGSRFQNESIDRGIEPR